MSDIDKHVGQRAQSTGRQRAEVLRRYVDRDMLHVATPEQTVNRLRYQGREEDARWFYERLADQSRARGVDGTEGPQTPSDVSPPAADGAANPEARDALVRGLIEESLIGTNDMQPSRFLERGALSARSIGRVVREVDRAAVGTGFLVAPGLMLTNAHVLPSKEAAGALLVQFNFRETADRTLPVPMEYRLLPQVIFMMSPLSQLDYALVAVEATNAEGAALTQLGYNPLIGVTGKTQQGARVNIVHHPDGSPQKVSIRQNFLALMLDNHLHYMTDTRGGSSGSPVFNDDWEIIALHHGSVPATDAKEIDLYHQVMGTSPTGAVPRVNEGVRVSRIVADIRAKANGVSGQGAPLVQRLLSAAPHAATELGHPGGGPAVQPGASGTGVVASVVSGGGLSVQIPLTVRVGFAGADGGGVAIDGASRERELEIQLELYKQSLNSQKSLIRGLTFLEQARERPYLPDAQEQQRRRDEYYGDLPARVTAGNVSPADLYDELRDIQEQTLQIVDAYPQVTADLESLARVRLESGLVTETRTEYARSRAHLYTWVDLQKTRMMQCVYTGTVIAPEQLVLKDALVEFGFKDLLPTNYANDRILNCEHIVPQSWFGKTGDALSDMHHLIAARGSANLYRRDTAYRQLDGAGAIGPVNRPAFVGPAGHKRGGEFEPARGKGLVARATLYFPIAHHQRIAATKYPAPARQTLIAWSDAEPPSEYELHRNEAIFEAQGNRNPLIDFPGWAGLIDYGRGLA